MILFLVVSSCFTIIIGSRLRDIRRMEGKIVGGEEIDIENVPHAAFLSITCVKEDSAPTFFCGASILNQITLITAAHCLSGCKPSTTIRVVVGEENKKSLTQLSAKRFVVHPDYNTDKDWNDIALIKMADPIEFGPRVKRVLLLKDRPKNYKKVYVAGWGIIDEELQTSTVFLKGSEQALISREECLELLNQIVPNGTLCAKGKKGTRHFGFASKGDSGGGLVVDDHILIGVVSFKLINDDTRHIVVYSDVTYYYDWILETSEDFLCSN